MNHILLELFAGIWLTNFTSWNIHGNINGEKLINFYTKISAKRRFYENKN